MQSLVDAILRSIVSGRKHSGLLVLEKKTGAELRIYEYVRTHVSLRTNITLSLPVGYDDRPIACERASSL